MIAIGRDEPAEDLFPAGLFLEAWNRFQADNLESRASAQMLAQVKSVYAAGMLAVQALLEEMAEPDSPRCTLAELAAAVHADIGRFIEVSFPE